MASDDRVTRQPLAPLDVSPPSPPVTILVIAFVVFVYAFFPALSFQLLMWAELVPPPPNAAETLAYLHHKMLADALAFPLQIASVLLLLPRLTGVRLEQIGLTFRRFGWNCLWGVVGWLLLTPVCLALLASVIALYGSQGASDVQEHPFVQMAQHGISPVEWFLLIFTATVSAAAMEELLFRGAVQPLLEQRVGLSHGVVLTLALLVSILVKEDGWAVAWSRGGRQLALYLAPVLFMLVLIVVYLVVWRLVRRPVAPAIIATSALFAAVHSNVWPTPVPLFVLALGLGWLAHRTRSLVGPIVLHSLFNAVACVELILKVNGVKW